MCIYVYNVCIYIYIMKNTLKKHPNLKILINHMANDQYQRVKSPAAGCQKRS